MSHPPLTIAGLSVPHPVYRRWRDREPTPEQAEAFLRGHQGDERAALGTESGWDLVFLRVWHQRGQALRRWVEEVPQREAARETQRSSMQRAASEAAAQRERRDDKASEEGHAARRAYIALRACPYPDRHPLRKAWRASWLAEQREAYERALAREEQR